MEIRGVILDAAGSAIAGALVEATNWQTHERRHTSADAAGQYRLSGLVTGSYDLTIKASGFRTLLVSGVVATVGQPRTLSNSLLPVDRMGLDRTDNSLTDGRGRWDLGAFLGGGSGAGKSSDTQFLFAGGRAGLVLTPDLFTATPIRGNFEYAVEVMPVYTVFTPNGAVYGGSIKPFVFRWNFTRPRRVIPYIHVAGGALFTTSNIPPGDTSSVNFTPQIGAGLHWFQRTDRSVDFTVDVVHHSNASLGNHNPGYNASVFFTVGYSWYKHRLF